MREQEKKWLLEDKYGGTPTAAYEDDLARLANGEPLAFIIGWVSFCGLRIYLDSHPLIPRPETEWWCEKLIAHLKETFADTPFSLLDMCAGSGAIGCAVLKAFPYATVMFVEIDASHKTTIQKNLRENAIDPSRGMIRIGNLFEPLSDTMFNIIASNPPYVPSTRTLDDSVQKYEPALALYAGTDGLSLIQQIAEEAPRHLSPSGELWLECDSEHAPDALSKVQAHAKNAVLHVDLYGRPRLVVGYF